jgi:D-amino peptidase
MKVYMSVDLEGITGVVGSYQVLQDPGALPEVRELVTGDVNAAIAGAKEAGATTIWVNENHSGRDLLIEKVDPMAEVIIGKPKPLMTLDGLDSSFDCVFMIGIHARAGTTGAVLDHTWVPKCVQALRVNGVAIGELGLNALAAGHFGVPIALVTGDTQVVREAHDLLGDVEGVAVKVGLDRYAARSPHPSKAREAIRQGAAKALREIERFKPFELSKPMKMEIDYANTAFATAASWIPTGVREGPQTVCFTVPDFLVGMKTFFVASAFPYLAADDPMF